MAAANTIIKLDLVLEDGNNDLVAFPIDLSDLAGVDNVLNLLERVSSIPRLASIPGITVVEGLRVNQDCLLGLGEKDCWIFDKLVEDLGFLIRGIRGTDIRGLFDIQDLKIHHLVLFGKEFISLGRLLEDLYRAGEAPESTTVPRYTHNIYSGGTEVSNKASSDSPADATSGVFGRAPQQYPYEASLGKPFGQFDAFERGKPIVTRPTVKVGDETHKGYFDKAWPPFLDVGTPLNTTTNGKFVEGYFHKAAIRAGIDQFDAAIHTGFDQFDAIKLVKSFLDIGHTLEDRNTCHGAFEVIGLVKSIVDIGHTLKGGDTSNEIANDLHKWHPAEAIPLGVTTGPCAVF